MPTVIQIIAVLLAIALTAWIVRPVRAQSPRLFVALAILIPLMGLALYRMLGAPVTLDPDAAPRPMAEAANRAGQDADPHVTEQQFAQALTQLKEQLARDPNQPQGWALLARSQAASGDYAAARTSFAKALELIPDDPMLLVEAAQTSAQAAPDNRFDDAAVAQLQRAIALQPQNQRARWFLGVSQRQRGAHAEAVKTWEALLAEVDPSTADSLRTQINDARVAANLPPLAASPAPAEAAADGSTQSAAAGAHALKIQLQIDPALRQQAGDASVFVIARVPGGPPMPVAVQRYRLASAPDTLTLGDGDGPMPTRKLSALDEVEVLARLSRSGSPMKQEGDVDSVPVRVKLPATQPVQLQLRQ